MRHTPEQIIRKLREGDKLLDQSSRPAEVAKHLEISEATWHRWVARYGGMKANDAKRLKEPERENAYLKRIVASSSARSCWRHAPTGATQDWISRQYPDSNSVRRLRPLRATNTLPTLQVRYVEC